MQGSRQSNEHVYTRSQKRNSSFSAPYSVGQEDRRSHPCKMRPCDSAERARVEHALPFSEIEVHHNGALGPTPVTTAPPTSKRSQTRRKPTAKFPTFVETWSCRTCTRQFRHTCRRRSKDAKQHGSVMDSYGNLNDGQFSKRPATADSLKFTQKLRRI